MDDAPAPGGRTLDAERDAGKERSRFLARSEPFRDLPTELVARLAAATSERAAPAGEIVLVEGGTPASELYVVRAGTFELVHREVVLDVVTSGEVFGHPSLLTGLAPEFTVRARESSTLICIPAGVALDVLSRPAGVRFVARTLRDRVLQAARTLSALPDIRTRPVTSLLHGRPVFCDPSTTIRDAARVMAAGEVSALLVDTPGGLGIVTDVDLRDKVVAGGVSRDAPVSSVMTTPVKTVGADVLAPEASVAMMEAGVNHLPVVDSRGAVVGVLSAGNLMALDALRPFALRQAIHAAHTEDEVVAVVADLPKLFVDLLDAGTTAVSLMRILSVLGDALTGRLLDLSIAQHGPPPVAFAWLALGSMARSELTLGSDQDNGLAYADTDDPAAHEYFRLVAEEVNAGLARCGFAADPHGVLAENREWRRSLSEWRGVFKDCLDGGDADWLIRASVAFDFRHVAGDLVIVPELSDILREAPKSRHFLSGLADLAASIRSPLGFRRRLVGPVDVKKCGMLPIQNLARYYAFSRGVTATSTLDRLVAVREAKGLDEEWERALREAFITVAELRLKHHAEAIRAGRAPDNAIDSEALRPVARVGLQEALRVIAAAQKRLPQQLPPR